MKSFKLDLKIALIALVIIILVSVSPVLTALADTAGPNNPGFGTNRTGIGTEAWQNPGNIKVPGSPYSTVTVYHGHLESNYLQGSGYGFAVPLDATISGIELNITRKSDSRNPNVVDSEVRLVKGGEIVSENRAITDTWPTTLTEVTYGGPTDLWGISWFPEDINSADFGAVLAVHRDNKGNNSRQALVDSMQITVYYGADSTTTVECGDGSPIVYGNSVFCTATVTNNGGSQTPSGNVTWTSDESGNFVPNPCALAGADGISTCTATYTPSAVGSGTHLLTASYPGDTIFDPSSASQSVAVVQRPVTVTADPQSKAYGDPDPLLTYHITKGNLVFGDAFSGSLTRVAGENVGQYAILQGSLALPIDYNLNYVGNDLNITKVDPNCTVSGFNGIYNRLPHAATGSCIGVNGETLDGLTLGASYTNVPGGIANWSFTDVTGIYNNDSGSVEIVISKAEAVCNFSGYTGIYDAVYHGATGGCVGIGGENPGTIDLGNTFKNVPGGTAYWTFTGNGNYINQNGNKLIVISKTEAVCSISGYVGAYDAAYHGATGSCSGIGGENPGTLNFGATFKNVPGGIAYWTFTSNGNYYNQNGDVEIFINKADPVCLVSPYLVEYDGEEHLATGSCTGVLGEELTGLDLTRTAHTDIGSYPSDSWTFTDVSGNYHNAAGVVSDVITLRSITITADDKYKFYGAPDPVFTYQVTAGSLLAGDTFTGTLIRVPGERLGVYSILQGTLSLPGYYSITFVAADLTIYTPVVYLPFIRR